MKTKQPIYTELGAVRLLEDFRSIRVSEASGEDTVLFGASFSRAAYATKTDQPRTFVCYSMKPIHPKLHVLLCLR